MREYIDKNVQRIYHILQQAVTGVVVDGKGYGLATIKLPVASPWAVTVE